MILLYNIALLVFSVFLFPWLLYRSLVKKKYRLGIRQRLGLYPKETIQKRLSKRLIWIQAVSVGEALAVKPLITGIRKRFPDYQILISTTTLTGYKICLEKIARPADIVIFFPFDYCWTIRRSLHLFKPSLIMLIETEIWPNFISIAAKMRVPVTLVNGRISDKSYRGYQRCRWLIKKVLSKIAWFGMQSARDAERIISLGADPQNVEVTPSLKYEGATELAGIAFDIKAIKEELMLPENAPLVVGGSTHAGEEEALIEAYLQLKSEFPDIALLLAPRHPNRVKEITEYLKKQSIAYNLRSELKQGSREYRPVIILDTLGELMKYYAVSTVVFIGKSLFGIGGQNPIEPAALAKPVIFGPNMSNFLESSELLVKNSAATRIEKKSELSDAIAQLIRNPVRAKEMGKRASAAISSMKGAADTILAAIGQKLGQ